MWHSCVTYSGNLLTKLELHDMLFEPLNAILSTPNKVRVLRALAPLTKGISGREVARLAGTSRSAQQALDELVEMGIVTRREATGQHLYVLNRRNYFATRIIRLFQSEQHRVQAIFSQLRQVINIVESSGTGAPILSMDVFGSTARGEARPDSDFDVIVIVDSVQQVEPVYMVLANVSTEMLERFSLRLSPIVIALNQLQSQYNDGDAFISSLLQDAITIYGQPLQGLIHEQPRETSAG